ncbi:hypothetical protein ECANGB1_305 [Enterospora canceri]|uniref:t-SNARE coiled-coil homology domain-containing protein n=1 Tax=Enterospora canceri TaxID=1081671 RepID=A0A1Y1S864_9MICR|nr:hypothetical protein ECANGB1_305 [Enterospora canceri]
MIKCRTLELVRQRNTGDTRVNEKCAGLDCGFIKRNLEKLENSVNEYDRLLKKENLPCFSENSARIARIEATKSNIDQIHQSIRNEISEFATEISYRSIRVIFIEYFTQQLERAMIRYRNIIRDNIHRTSSFEILNSVNSPTATFDNNMFELQLKTNSNELINQSLLNISNTLAEMKINLKEQSLSIDSLDRYFENTNRYLDLANEEIRKIPKRFVRLKDKAIKLLIIVICCMLGALLMKEWEKNSTFRNSETINEPDEVTESREASISS